MVVISGECRIIWTFGDRWLNFDMSRGEGWVVTGSRSTDN